jgi:hypothetical protein
MDQQRILSETALQASQASNATVAPSKQQQLDITADFSWLYLAQSMCQMLSRL